MHPISRPYFCGPHSPMSHGLAAVLGARPRSGAPGRQISRRLLDRRSRPALPCCLPPPPPPGGGGGGGWGAGVGINRGGAGTATAVVGQVPSGAARNPSGSLASIA